MGIKQKHHSLSHSRHLKVFIPEFWAVRTLPPQPVCLQQSAVVLKLKLLLCLESDALPLCDEAGPYYVCICGDKQLTF